MISPLGQRQILQTAAVETVRLAMDGAAQVQREQAKRQAFDAKLLEAMEDVADVAETDSLKLGEQDARERRQRHEGGTGASGEPEEAVEHPAERAEPHLDLLA
jgi:hypothetical protein